MIGRDKNEQFLKSSRNVPTPIELGWYFGTFRELLKNCSFLFIPFILGIWGVISGYQTSGPLHIVPTNHSQPTEVAGTRIKGPKSLSQVWFQKSGEKLGQIWNRDIVTVLDVPGPPNFAGTLVRSIPTRFNRFWDVSGTFKKLFIFVHSVHSGNLGHHFGLPTVRSSSHCPYQS